MAKNNILQKHVEEFTKLRGLIERAQGIIVATHCDPDADAIGAAFAISRIAAHFGKGVCVFLPDGIPRELSFLSAPVLPHASPDTLAGDTLVALDYGDFPRTELDEYSTAHPLRTATIDHHPLSDHRGEVIIVDTSASSTCEIVHRFAVFAGVPVDRELATELLAGMLFDTGGLQHSNTSAETLRVVSELSWQGGRLHKIARALHATAELAHLRLGAAALARIAYDSELGMSYTVVRYKELAALAGEPDLSFITHLLGTGKEQKFAAVFKEEEPGKFRVSLRSEAFKGVDVSAIAKRLGGGGHRCASGCRVEGSFEEALEKIRQAAKNVIV